MNRIVLIGSHLGYPMDRTPLGGGAMVSVQLVRQWAKDRCPVLTVIGSGPEAPDPGFPYIKLPLGTHSPDLVRLSERRYARFCRTFEDAATRYLIRQSSVWDPSATAVIVNDISESPNLEKIAKLGYRIISIWHVDVVDFFNRMYLGNGLTPQRLTRTFLWLERKKMTRFLPDILRLVFEKQQRAVENADLLVLPSRPMVDTIRSCYPDKEFNSPDGQSRFLVLPWGGWHEDISEKEVENQVARLRETYQVRPESRVLMTLSRISPEKGIHHLLEALGQLERQPAWAESDLCLFICGEAAFMRGEAYARRLRKAVRGLGRFRVFFPGYLSAEAKSAHFRLANLFVSASIHESYGLTLVEAMQAGLPILTSDHYGVNEIVRPSYGRIVSYRDPSSRSQNLADALNELWIDRENLEEMGRRARAAAGKMTFQGAARKLWETASDLVEPKNSRVARPLAFAKPLHRPSMDSGVQAS